MITLASNAFVYVALYLAINDGVLGAFTPLAIALCLLIYLVGDHLDGMQANRTATGSALGEFCGHYLDAFNNGIVVYTMLSFFHVNQADIVGGSIVLSYLAHSAIFYEQFRTGWLRFERIGSLEGVLLASLLIALSSFDAVYLFMTRHILSGFTLAECIILASAFGAFITFVQTVYRIPAIKADYWLFTVLLLIVGALSMISLSLMQLFIILTLYASLYIGRVMYGHLIDGEEPSVDWIVPTLMLAYVLIELTNTTHTFWILTAYLIVRILILVVRTFQALRDFWLWQNSRA
jgi:ethanolaminephosphotransferase